MPTSSLQFGLVVPPVAPVGVLRQRWAEVEAFGYDSLWFPDHLMNPLNPGGTWFDAWELLAVAAIETRRLTVGVMVSSPVLRSAAALVRAATTVNELSQGRLALGIGAGGARLDYLVAGEPIPDPTERRVVFQEYLRSVQSLMPELNRTDSHRPRIVVASRRAATLDYVVQYADTWNVTIFDSMDQDRETLVDAIGRIGNLAEQLTSQCIKHGRNPASLTRSVLIGRSGPLGSPWVSEEQFNAIVSACHDVGFTEFLLYYPTADERTHGEFERISLRSIPALKASEARNAPGQR